VQVFRRAAALLAVHAGRSVHEVASVLGVTGQTIHNWLNCCDTDGPDLNLKDAPRAGRPSIGAGELDQLLEQTLGVSPVEFGYAAAQWTCPLLREHVLWLHGPGVSGETIRRRLRRLGYGWKGRRYVRKRPMERP
jgi:transposase